MEFVQNVLRWGAKYVMDLIYLIELVISWEKRKECSHLKEDTASSPIVHFVIIIAISQETFWWTIPSRRDILCKWWLGVDSSTRPEISQLNLVILYQDIFSTSNISAKRCTVLCLCEKFHSYAYDLWP